jgi:PAS domain S-box-containing protein
MCVASSTDDGIEDETFPRDAGEISREGLRSILSGIPAAVLVAHAPAGACLDASPDAVALLGADAAGSLSILEQLTRRVDGTPYAAGDFPLTRALTHSEIARDELVLFGAPGDEPRSLRMSCSPVIGADGNAVAAALVAVDVTEHRRVERDARRDREDFLDFFENAMEGLHWAGPDGTILWANRAEMDLLGYTADEYFGRNLREFHADPKVVEDILERLNRGESLQNFEARLRARDGSIKHVLIHANALWFEGRFIHTRCFTRDVTDRKHLEHQLLRRVRELASADKRKDDFLALLGHELRNPLAALSAAGEMMGAGDDPDTVRRGLAIIARQTRQMARLTDDLLDVARITHGKIALRREVVDAASVVDGAVEAADSIFSQAERSLSVSRESGLFVSADAARLEQVLLNLLVNAARHAGANSNAWLEARRHGGEVVIRVCDDGVGFSHDILPRVFEPFRQTAASVGDSGGGLGIGLSLVKSLVELHDGTVEALSDGPGRGSQFVVRLPAAAAPETSATSPTTSAPGGPAGRRVLLVDDNADAVDAMSEILQMHGYETLVAHSGHQAVETALSERPDTILLDIGLPGLDGYGVARRLRESGARPDTLMVAMTGFGQAADIERSRSAGFHHHLVKPVDVRALLDLLARGAAPPAQE